MLVDAAKEAGCDAVKVQAYRCEDFLPVGHRDWTMFEACEMSLDTIARVGVRCDELGLRWGATPTSVEMVGYLQFLEVGFLKNGSDFLLRHDLIRAMAATGIETWVSLGMATEDEMWALRDLMPKINFMHCTSAYPCPDNEANLLRVFTEPDSVLGYCAGFSDHTEGGVAAVAATALLVASGIGNPMYERHFTLDKWLPGPDHHFSADPTEMAQLVRDVRRVEVMLGDGALGPTPSELVNRDKWRVREGSVRSG